MDLPGCCCISCELRRCRTLVEQPPHKVLLLAEPQQKLLRRLGALRHEYPHAAEFWQRSGAIYARNVLASPKQAVTDATDFAEVRCVSVGDCYELEILGPGEDDQRILSHFHGRRGRRRNIYRELVLLRVIRNLLMRYSRFSRSHPLTTTSQYTKLATNNAFKGSAEKVIQLMPPLVKICDDRWFRAIACEVGR